jgi:hypothetical protein
METLIEVFPFAFGVLLGLTWARFGGPNAWRGQWVAAGVALGAFATFASGEWQVSQLYFLFDIALVLVVSAGTLFALKYWQRRRMKG